MRLSSLDSRIPIFRQANSCSFSTFITTRTTPLLDLSLYVTSQNYRLQTSPSYASLLTFPNQWLLPPQLHASAKTRAEHLGLSSLDLDAIEDQRKREHSAAVAAGHIPRNFIQRPRDTVSSLLGQTSQQNQFRLEAVTGEVFEPLEEMFVQHTDKKGGKGEHFLGLERPSSLDALATGYLSLALIPDLKSPWLRDAMNSKAPTVSNYITQMRASCFGSDPIDPVHALHPDQFPSTQHHLPWQPPERPSLPQITSTIISTLADTIPIWKDFRTNARIGQMASARDSGLSDEDREALSGFAKGSRSDLLLSLGAVGGGVVALVGYMASVGLLGGSNERLEGDGTEGDGDEFVLGESQTGGDILAAL